MRPGSAGRTLSEPKVYGPGCPGSNDNTAGAGITACPCNTTAMVITPDWPGISFAGFIEVTNRQ
jgi:hypothetical protein